MSRFIPYGVVINSTTIGGITDQSIDTGAEVNSEVTAGGTSPQFGELAAIATGGQFQGHDVAAMLTAIGSRGLCLEGDDAPGFALWTLTKNDCGTLASGSVHRKLIIPNGLVVPRTLTIQQGQRASLTCEVFGIFDGTNDPIIVSTSLAAPTGLTDVIGFHLGETKVGNVAITNIQQISLDFGIEVQPEYDDGESFPKSLHIGKVQPVMSITTHDVSKFGSSGVPLQGLAGTHANTYTIARKRAIGTSSFVAAAEHAKLTMAGVVTVKQAANASSNGVHGMTIMVTSLDDGTNDMVDIDLAHDLTP